MTNVFRDKKQGSYQDTPRRSILKTITKSYLARLTTPVMYLAFWCYTEFVYLNFGRIADLFLLNVHMFRILVFSSMPIIRNILFIYKFMFICLKVCLHHYHNLHHWKLLGSFFITFGVSFRWEVYFSYYVRPKSVLWPLTSQLHLLRCNSTWNWFMVRLK